MGAPDIWLISIGKETFIGKDVEEKEGKTNDLYETRDLWLF